VGRSSPLRPVIAGRSWEAMAGIHGALPLSADTALTMSLNSRPETAVPNVNFSTHLKMLLRLLASS
jgi:hypothetical protein